MDEKNQAEAQKTPAYIRSFLKEPPMILKNFHHEDIMEFLKCGIREEFVQDDVIITEGDYVNSAYLVAEGEVSIWKNNIELATLSPGNFLGETFLFSKNYRTAKVVSVNHSVLLKFERPATLNFFRKKPEKLFNILTRNIIKIQQGKISKMNNQLYHLKKRLLNNPNQ